MAVDSDQDQAQLSVDGQAIQQLKTTLSGVPEIRQERVNALRQAVSSGNDQISDQQLSNAIASELLAGQISLS
jgi:anti-sigma28 factor (negative regulator of flagellin synthesis)